MWRRTLAAHPRALWCSPLVINNALCSRLLKYRGRLRTSAPLSAVADCVHGCRSPQFAAELHQVFIEAVRSGELDAFQAKHYAVELDNSGA